MCCFLNEQLHLKLINKISRKSKMEDFDILYMMKTPFYLGDYDKALQEGNHIEVNSEDLKN